MQADSAVHNQEGQPRDEQLTALIAQRDAMITQVGRHDMSPNEDHSTNRPVLQTSPAAITLSPAAEAKANAASLRKSKQRVVNSRLSKADSTPLTQQPNSPPLFRQPPRQEPRPPRSVNVSSALATIASSKLTPLLAQQSTDLGSLAHALKMHHDLLGNDIKALETEKQYLEEKMTVLNGSDTLSSKRTHAVAFGSTGATPFTPPRSGATTSETPPSAPPESFSDMLVRSHKRKNPYNVFKMG
jgi:hypothetical protein